MQLITPQIVFDELKQAKVLLRGLPHWKVSERLRIQLRIKQLEEFKQKVAQ